MRIKSRHWILLVMLFFLLVTSVSAQWFGQGSNYAITTDWHGKDVPLLEEVTAWAGTRDSRVTRVEFVWKDPSGNIVWDDTVAVSGSYVTPNVPAGVPEDIVEWSNKYPGKNVWYATCMHIPDVPGDWGVQALFKDSEAGHIRGQNSEIVAIRATSFNVIPEVAVLGTIGAAAAMLLGIGLFTIRRNKLL